MDNVAAAAVVARSCHRAVATTISTTPPLPAFNPANRPPSSPRFRGKGTSASGGGGQNEMDNTAAAAVVWFPTILYLAKVAFSEELAEAAWRCRRWLVLSFLGRGGFCEGGIKTGSTSGKGACRCR